MGQRVDVPGIGRAYRPCVVARLNGEAGRLQPVAGVLEFRALDARFRAVETEVSAEIPGSMPPDVEKDPGLAAFDIDGGHQQHRRVEQCAERNRPTICRTRGSNENTSVGYARWLSITDAALALCVDHETVEIALRFRVAGNRQQIDAARGRSRAWVLTVTTNCSRD